MPKHPLRLAAVPIAASVLLAGCAAPAPDPADDGVIRIVASTDVYGSIAAAIAGDDAEVTAIIDDPSADPHGYQADAHTQLALSKADLVVRNGGGYDDFVDLMLDAAGTHPVVLTAVDLAPVAPGAPDFNEHVWFDYPTMDALAGAIADALSDLDPDRADMFAANRDAFRAGIGDLSRSVAGLPAEHAGDGVIVTEPLPLYLLDAAGFVNRTPEAFMSAIEEGNDAPARALEATLDLIAGGDVRLVVDNEQTGGAQTDAVLAAAREAGVPALGVTETLPAGLDYLGWQTGVVAALSAAVAG